MKKINVCIIFLKCEIKLTSGCISINPFGQYEMMQMIMMNVVTAIHLIMYSH